MPPPTADVPARIQRPFLRDLADVETCSAVTTPHTAFGRSFLVEVGRGCPHGCRFCSAGFLYRPLRFRPAERLAQTVEKGLAHTDQIGLVGAAVSDLPGLAELCAGFGGRGAVGFTVPNQSGLIGARFFNQFVVLDAPPNPMGAASV